MILNTSMDEALKMVVVSKEIREALVDHKGVLAPVMEFVLKYEKADWQEISRLMILQNISMTQVYDAYMQSLQWYCDLFTRE